MGRVLQAKMLIAAGLFSAGVVAPGLAAGPFERPMRLGADPVELRAPARSGAATGPAEKCSKWRRIADRLGETFAGLRLRRSVVARTCAFAEQAPAEETVWSWPWARGEIDGALPPRFHASFGSWTIRCGASGRRERCALINEAEANILPGDGGAERVRVVTHFVIDEIGGQERVLWRVFVDRVEPHWFNATSHSLAVSPATDIVRVHSGAVMVRKSFDDCGRFGCLMEADVGAGAKVATRLWDGGNLQIDIRPAPGLTISQSVPASGFRQGLAELSKLKRHEQRMLAGK